MPYASDAQRRYFNANRSSLEAQGVNVDEWNASSRGKKLPKKIKKKASVAGWVAKRAAAQSGAQQARSAQQSCGAVTEVAGGRKSASFDSVVARTYLQGVLAAPRPCLDPRFLLKAALVDDPICLDSLCRESLSPQIAPINPTQLPMAASFKLAAYRKFAWLTGHMRGPALERLTAEKGAFAQTMLPHDAAAAHPMTGLDAPTAPGVPNPAEAGIGTTTPGQTLVGPPGTRNSPSTNPIGMFSGIGAAPGMGSTMGNASLGVKNDAGSPGVKLSSWVKQAAARQTGKQRLQKLYARRPDMEAKHKRANDLQPKGQFAKTADVLGSVGGAPVQATGSGTSQRNKIMMQIEHGLKAQEPNRLMMPPMPPGPLGQSAALPPAAPPPGMAGPPAAGGASPAAPPVPTPAAGAAPPPAAPPITPPASVPTAGEAKLAWARKLAAEPMPLKPVVPTTPKPATPAPVTTPAQPPQAIQAPKPAIPAQPAVPAQPATPPAATGAPAPAAGAAAEGAAAAAAGPPPVALPTEWGESPFGAYQQKRGLTDMMKGFGKLTPEQQKGWATNPNYSFYAKRPEAQVFNSWGTMSPEQRNLAYKTWDTKPAPPPPKPLPIDPETGMPMKPKGSYRTLMGVRLPGEMYLPDDPVTGKPRQLKGLEKGWWDIFHSPQSSETSRATAASWLKELGVPGYEGANPLPKRGK